MNDLKELAKAVIEDISRYEPHEKMIAFLIIGMFAFIIPIVVPLMLIGWLLFNIGKKIVK